MIHIPFKNFTIPGGPTTFMQNLKDFLDSKEFKYSDKHENAEVIFFPIAYDLEVIEQHKAKKGKIIQRLDGIYYPTKHGDDYITHNKTLKEIYLNYTDFVIFQSDYSLRQCFAMLGNKQPNEYTKIVNGVNKQIFTAKNQSLVLKYKFVTTGHFRNFDMIEPIILALDNCFKNIQFELHVVGPVFEKLKYLLNRQYIVYHGTKNLNEISEILNSCDIYIYSHLNPPCPNSVLEAISCGLPLVGFDSGAMTELCWFSKDLLTYVSDDIFQRYEDFDYRKLAEKIELCIEKYPYYKQIALEHAHLYSFEECGNKYIEVFSNIKKTKQVTKLNTIPIQIKTNIAMKQKIKNYIAKKLHLIPKTSDNINNEILKNSETDLAKLILQLIEKKSTELPPLEALKFQFEIENKLYELQGQTSVRYGNGIHSKHRHLKYHDFFINNIPANSRILDVGCGNGSLAKSIATRTDKTKIYAIDIIEQNIKKAKEINSAENIFYVCGDALSDLPDEKFDIIVLSNVLEHIELRIEFLKKLTEKYNPQKFLIRVPLFERDWRVPLKREIGIDYRLDSTHFIEYIQEEFFNEIETANLKINHYQIRWGEIWAEVIQK